MIRPCDDCGGSGEIEEGYSSPVDNIDVDVMTVECGRCADMPKLVTTPKQLQIPAGIDTHGAWGRGWFKPDPDTVLEWCSAHNAVMQGWDVDGSNLRACLHAVAILKNPFDCAPGWVAVPERLEVAE